MSQLVVKKNGERMPSLLSDFFDNDWLLDTGFFDRDWGMLPSMRRMMHFPSANITENDKEYLIDLAVPGLEKKDFRINLDNNILTVSAEREEKSEAMKAGHTHKEYSYNSFSRSFRLPENSKPDKIEAEYKDGVLMIMIPKKEITPARSATKIPVK